MYFVFNKHILHSKNPFVVKSLCTAETIQDGDLWSTSILDVVFLDMDQSILSWIWTSSLH